jgi:small subunit ribosomal protein S17
VAEAEPAAEEAVEPAEAPLAAEEPVAVDDAVAESEPAPEGDAEAAEAEPVAEAPAAPPAKKKRKRVARSERRQRPKPTREAPKTRKPLTRQPKPEHERGRTQERRGVVVSNAMDKTIVVRVDSLKTHPVYKKVIRRSAKFHAHDEGNSANVGDVVRIVETRPLSKTKRWRLAEVLEVAK